MRLTGLMACALFLVVTSLTAQLSTKSGDWADGPEGLLLTAAERETWATIVDDTAAREFIDLFWARRDPDLSTRENDFRIEFDRRIAAADTEFGIDGQRGAMTDRGRTFLLLGMPSEHARIPIGDYLSELYRTGRAPEGRSSDPEAHVQMHGVTFSLHKGVADVWGYQRDDLPDGIEWSDKGDTITFAFLDHDGTGHFRTQLGIRKAAEAAAVLASAPAALVRHPGLEAVPVFGLIPGIEAAGADELGWLQSGVEMEGVVATVENGIGGRGVLVSWLSLRIPEAAAGQLTLVGLVKSGGESVGCFRLGVEPVAGALGTTYELALPVPAGDYSLELALAQGGAPIHVERLDFIVEEFEDVFLTQVFAGAEVEKDDDAGAGEPFVFGGYHLVPRSDGRYRTGENLALFCMVTASEGVAEIRSGKVSMRWYVDGKATAKQPARPAQFQPAGDGQWVWGTQLPLDSLAPGPDYELKITVEDSVSEISRTTRIPVLFAE